MESTRCHLPALVLASILPGLAPAQIPNTLLHTFLPPPVGGQREPQSGRSVAVEGDYTVTGAPFDGTGAHNAGIVKVYDSTTGALVRVLPNPNLATSGNFGISVAISGTLVVAGAYLDNTGAISAGRAYVYDLSSGTPTLPIATLNNPTPSDGDYFGWSVAISGTRVVVGAYRDDTGSNDTGSVYVYDLGSATPAVPVAALNNPAPAAGDGFGYSVAISGTRVVVGANNDDAGAADAGSAYVYDLSNATPTVPVTTLNNPGPASNDYFGYSVAVSGTQVVVGAYGDDTGMADAGSAYVYDVSSAIPAVPVATLTNPGPAASDYFGWSVAISGMRVVVGTINDDPGAGNAGSACVYDLSGAAPTVPVAALNNPGPAVDDNFGWCVAIAGTRVVVGAPFDDTGAFNAGSAYVYDLGSGTPTVPLATLNNPGPAANDQFGSSVAISGTRLVVGAFFEDPGMTTGGSAYVYELSSATPTVPVVTLSNPGPAVSDFFGYSVAISGARVVVGAYSDNTGANDAGSAYVYDLSSAVPAVPVATLNNPGPALRDEFGSTVAISGTLIVVGASRDDTGATDAGSAYVYNLSSVTPAAPVATLNNPGPATSDFFGSAVAISGTRVVVGAYQDDTGATDTGSAYIYDLASLTPAVPVTTLNNPGPAGNDFFGYSVAIAGALVVVGAYRDDTGASDAGSVYVYDLSSATPTVPVTTLNNPGPAAGDNFGYTVAISGTRVVVGVPGDDMGAGNAGNVYVYDLNSAIPAVPVAILNNPRPGPGDLFGYSVAISGTSVAIGTPRDDTVMSDKGAACLFGPHPLDQDSDGLLDSWELTYWPATAGHGPLDDFDHDGYNELLELAFGLNPTISDPGGLPAVTNEGGYLTLTIIKQPGVTYEVQSAGTVLPALPDSFSPATTTVLSNNATTLKVRDNVLIGTTPARFLRTKVTAAP